jgi:hypothetical protein
MVQREFQPICLVCEVGEKPASRERGGPKSAGGLTARVSGNVMQSRAGALRSILFAIAAVAISNPATAQLACQQFGNQTYCNNGQTFSAYGNQTYDNRGNSWQSYGNMTYGPGGPYQTYGNQTYTPQGTY